MKQVRFYVGCSDTDTRLPDALLNIARSYGGYTLISARGAWVDPVTNAIVTEPSVIIEVSTEKYLDAIKKTAEYLRETFGQECVLMTVNLTTESFFVFAENTHRLPGGPHENYAK